MRTGNVRAVQYRFFFSSRRRHTRFDCDWSSDVCSSDLHPGIVVVDTRSPDAYARCHIPGAINLPTRTISPETTASLPRDKVIVAYCWGPGCNGSTRAAAKLAGLGVRVQEMIAGIGYWTKEGLPVEGSSPADAPLYA